MNLQIFVMYFRKNKTLLTAKIGLRAEQELRLDLTIKPQNFRGIEFSTEKCKLALFKDGSPLAKRKKKGK